MGNVTFSDFQKLDIRIGTVVAAEVPEWSHWVIKLKVDFGAEIGEKTGFSGIMKFYKPADLEGRQFPFIVNLEPKTIGPKKELSECMMLMAVERDDEETPPVFFHLAENVPNGTRVK